MTKLFKGLWCRPPAKLVLKNPNVLSRPLGGTDLCSLNYKLYNFLKTFFPPPYYLCKVLSPEETFKLFIIFYFWLINTDMTDVVLEHTVRNYKKTTTFSFLQGFIMKQFKYNWLGNDLVYIAVWGGEYFDENAEKGRKHHVSVNENHKSISCKWYALSKSSMHAKGRDILCM